MEIFTTSLSYSTQGNTDILDITGDVGSIVRKEGFREGNILLFVVGSTGSLSTIEYEPGLQRDYPEFMQSIIPQGKSYHHDNTWHDGNGHSHLRATLQGPSLTIPFVDNELLLGTWQQIILIDFDNRPRQRKIVAQITGVK